MKDITLTELSDFMPFVGGEIIGAEQPEPGLFYIEIRRHGRRRTLVIDCVNGITAATQPY